MATALAHVAKPAGRASAAECASGKRRGGPRSGAAWCSAWPETPRVYAHPPCRNSPSSFQVLPSACHVSGRGMVTNARLTESAHPSHFLGSSAARPTLSARDRSCRGYLFSFRTAAGPWRFERLFSRHSWHSICLSWCSRPEAVVLGRTKERAMRTIMFVAAMGLIAESSAAHAQVGHRAGSRADDGAANGLTAAGQLQGRSRGLASASFRPRADDRPAPVSVENGKAPAYGDHSVDAARWTVIVLLFGLSVPVLHCFVAIGSSVIGDRLTDRQLSHWMAASDAPSGRFGSRASPGGSRPACSSRTGRN